MVKSKLISFEGIDGSAFPDGTIIKFNLSDAE